MARLSARFWVDAYLTRLRGADIPAFVVAHGDDTGGLFWSSSTRWMEKVLFFNALLI